MTTFIYVVQSQIGHIKIGCSMRPEGRAQAMNAASPVPCRLIAKWPGDTYAEQQLHREFCRSRHFREWFQPTAEIQQFVGDCFGRGLDEVEEFEASPVASEDWERLPALRRSEARRSAEPSAEPCAEPSAEPENNLLSSFGGRLQRARQTAGFRSGSAAAGHHGWTVSTYLAHENGTRVPRTPSIVEYATAFDVPYAWLAIGDVQALKPKAEAGSIAERLRMARLSAGFESASEAVRSFGWIPSTYLSHENGARVPRLHAIQTYAEAFGTDAAWLMLGTNQPGQA